VKIRYTRRAIREIERIDGWWRQNRDAKDLFLDELDAALRQLSDLPDIGARYETRRGSSVLRLLLPKTKHHVYFRRDPPQNRIMVVSVWSARRRRGPRL